MGLIIDQHLIWKHHIDFLTMKIIKLSGVLCRVRFFISQPLLKLLYNSLIYPCLYYGNIVWGNNYPTRLEKLIRLQKKVLRIITFSTYTAPSLPLFKKLNLLNLNQINDLLIATFGYNLANKTLPPYFKDFCIDNNNVHDHNTRNCRKLHKVRNRTNFGVYSTRNKTIDIWNIIPFAIKNSLSLLSFNRKMKDFLLSSL